MHIREENGLHSNSKNVGVYYKNCSIEAIATLTFTLALALYYTHQNLCQKV